HRRVTAVGQEAAGGAGVPVVGVRQQFDQFRARPLGEVQSANRGRVAVGDAVDAAVAAVPRRVRVGVGGAGVVPVGDVNAAVRAEGHVARGEPGVVGQEQLAAEIGRAHV